MSDSTSPTETCIDALTPRCSRTARLRLLSGATAWTTLRRSRPSGCARMVHLGRPGRRPRHRAGTSGTGARPRPFADGDGGHLVSRSTPGGRGRRRWAGRGGVAQGCRRGAAPTARTCTAAARGGYFEGASAEDLLLYGCIGVAYVARPAGRRCRRDGPSTTWPTSRRPIGSPSTPSPGWTERTARAVPARCSSSDGQRGRRAAGDGRLQQLSTAPTMSEHPAAHLLLSKDEWGFDGVVVSDWYADQDDGGRAGSRSRWRWPSCPACGARGAPASWSRPCGLTMSRESAVDDKVLGACGWRGGSARWTVPRARRRTCGARVAGTVRASGCR